MDLSPDKIAALDQIYGGAQPSLSPEKMAALDKIYGSNTAPGQDSGAGTAAVQGFNSTVPFGNRITAFMEPWEQFSQPANDTGFMSRVGNDLSKRGDFIKNQIISNATSQQTLPETIYNIAGKGGVGAINDVIGEGIVSAGNAVPDFIKQPFKSGASKIGQALGDTDTAAYLVDKGKNAVGAYQDFAKANPRVSNIIDSTANIATLVPTVKAAEPVSEAAGNVLSKTGRAIADASDAKSLAKQVGADQLDAFSSKAYDAARAAGGTIAPESFDNFLNNAANVLPKSEQAKAAFGNGVATNFIENLVPFKGKSLDFAAAEELDKGLGAKITQAYRAGDNVEAARLIGIQSELRKAVDTLPDASAEVKKAKGLFSAAANQRLIESILERAQYTDNPATSIRVGFRNLAAEVRKNPRGWTTQEVNAIQKAAKTGLGTDLLKLAGSRLNPIAAAATGGVGGAAATGLVSAGARSLAEIAQASRAGKVTKEIMARPVVQDAIKSAAEAGDIAPKMTIQKGLGITLDAAGNVLRFGKPMTEKEIFNLPPDIAKTILGHMKRPKS